MATKQYNRAYQKGFRAGYKQVRREADGDVGDRAEQCVCRVRSLLAEGPQTSTHCYTVLYAEGFGRNLIQAACRMLGVRHKRFYVDGQLCHLWVLPRARGVVVNVNVA